MPMSPVVVAVAVLLASAPPSAKRCTVVPQGRWGGSTAELRVAASEATIQLACGQGHLTGPLRLDARGRSAVRGTYSRWTGAEPKAASPTRQDVRYLLRGDCRRLQVTIVLPDRNKLGPFAVALGDQTEAPSCLAAPPPRGRTQE